jgi:hypothetical protein
MEVSGQLYTPAVLPLVNEPLVFIEYGDGVDSRTNMNVLEKVLVLLPGIETPILA